MRGEFLELGDEGVGFVFGGGVLRGGGFLG